jgi:hypothetical protein
MLVAEIRGPVLSQQLIHVYNDLRLVTQSSARRCSQDMHRCREPSFCGALEEVVRHGFFDSQEIQKLDYSRGDHRLYW